MEQQRLLTIPEAAERIGISVGYMRELLQAGEIAHIRLGTPPPRGQMDRRRYRITEEDLAHYIEMRRVAGTMRGVRDQTVREWRRRRFV